MEKQKQPSAQVDVSDAGVTDSGAVAVKKRATRFRVPPTLPRQSLQEQIANARAAFIYRRLNEKLISIEMDVSYERVRSWRRDALKRGDDWEKARAANVMSAGGASETLSSITNEFMIFFNATMALANNDDSLTTLQRMELMGKCTDSYSKFQAALHRHDPRMSRLAIAMDVIRLQAKFVTEQCPEHKGAVGEVLEKFAPYLNAHFGQKV